MKRAGAVTAALAGAALIVGTGPAAWASSHQKDRSDSGPSASQAPAGNNGHIQIDEYAMDGGNGNDPHVGCGFSVSFFGYDAGTRTAEVSVTPWAPTSGGTPFHSGTLTWQVNQRTSGNQLDFNYPVSPATVASIFQGVTPAHQGYHARVEVEVSGSHGSDDKHKMVWISPCSKDAGGSTAPAASPAPSGSAGTSAADNDTDNDTQKASASDSDTDNDTQGASATDHDTDNDTQEASASDSDTDTDTAGASTGPAAPSGTANAALLTPSGAEASAPTASTLAATSSTGQAPGAGPLASAGLPGGASVMGESVSRPVVATAPTGTATSPAGGLPFTGADIALESLVSLGLLGTGAFLTRRYRLRRR